MKEKVKLEFDQSGFDLLKKTVEQTGNILIEAKEELNRLGVKCNAKELLDGRFVQRFHRHHKTAQKKEKGDFARRISYEKYIDSLELNPSKLIKLAEEYDLRIDRSKEMYKSNNSFYQYCETRSYRDSSLKKFVENAPRKIKLEIKKLFKVEDNKLEVNIDAELFTLYATNEKQIERISEVKNLVALCKKLDIKREEIKPLVDQYLFDDSNLPHQIRSGKVGLSLDLENINFNYNKILTIS